MAMSDTRTMSLMDETRRLSKELSDLKSVKYKMGEWEDMEENLALITLKEMRLERLQRELQALQGK